MFSSEFFHYRGLVFKLRQKFVNFTILMIHLLHYTTFHHTIHKGYHFCVLNVLKIWCNFALNFLTYSLKRKSSPSLISDIS